MNVDGKIHVSGVADEFVVIPRSTAMQIRDDYAARMVSAEIDGITPRSRALREIVQALEIAIGEKAQVVL